MPFIYRAELGIHEADVLRQNQLADGDVRAALQWMVGQLSAGALPDVRDNLASEDGSPVIGEETRPHDLIAWRITDNWQTEFAESWTPSNRDLAGVLREILKSVDVWTQGPRSRGYLVYVRDFLREMGVTVDLVDADGVPLTGEGALSAQALKELDRHTEKGYELLQKGRYKRAERMFEKSLEIATGDATLCRLATVYAMTDRNEEAFETLMHVIENWDSAYDVYYNLGQAAIQTWRMGRALWAVRECLRRGRSEMDGEMLTEVQERIRLLRTGLREMQGEWGRRLPLAKLMEHEETYHQATLTMGEGRFEEAEELFRRSIELNDRHYQSWGNLGVCLLQQERYDEAEEALRQALEINPSYEIARFNLETLPAARAGGPREMVMTNEVNRTKPSLKFLK